MFGKQPLEAYAMHLGRNTWLDTPPADNTQFDDMVWLGQGPENVPIYALRNGFLIFDFTASDRYRGGDVPNIPLINGRFIPLEVDKARKTRDELRYKRFSYMNAAILAIYSAYVEVQQTGGFLPLMLSPKNYYKASVTHGKYSILGIMESGYELPNGNSAMSCDTLQTGFELLNESYKTLGQGYTELLSLALQACTQYSEHHFSASHLSAWCIAEAMLQHLWKNYLNECSKHTKFNRNRKDLLSGRDYSASAVSQILSLAGLLDDEILEKLDSARKVRNSFAHSLDPISSTQSSAAIRTAGEMMGKVIGRTIYTQVGYSVYE